MTFLSFDHLLLLVTSGVPIVFRRHVLFLPYIDIIFHIHRPELHI